MVESRDNTNWNFDRGPHNMIGGFSLSSGFNTALPIGFRPVPRGTPPSRQDASDFSVGQRHQIVVGRAVANRGKALGVDRPVDR